MLTASKLEKIMELEAKLRDEYQAKLDAQAAELAQCRQQLDEQKQEMQATIDKQLATIGELSSRATASQNVEQQNRELNNRSEKLQEEVTTLKKRVKTLQKDLASEREQLKQLTQYDPVRMKKNLDTNKKKLAEKTRANELLQKALNKAKSENGELQHKVQELESQQAEKAADEQREDEAA